ncbi:unnamed protein product [Clonostachys solani]|uniref:Heterokaryon incompatibility domain-containing protein n=1 Tax=Clonostachys solani TaxID=160281 RepID=A0A9N9W7J7_9HYPO|nr:unnamed protein product [Clonostachys solani]
MKRYRDVRSYMELRREEIREYGIPFVEKDYQKYKALYGVVKRPWFTRTWIIQEIALAREAVICCGKWEILWSSLAPAWDFVEVLRVAGFFQLMSGSRSGSTVVDLDETVAAISSDKRLPLIDLLCHHSHAQVTDERDRVFALKGIVSDSDTIRVDYDKPMIQVFWDTALAVMNKSRNLDLLSDAAVRPTPTDPDWPSWLPAWHQGYHAIHMTNYIRDFGHCASRDSSCSPIVASEGGRIQLRGYELDWITDIGALTTGHRFRDSGWTFSADRSAWADWSRMCGAFTNKTYGPTGEPMTDVFRAILTRGTLATFPSSGDPIHDMDILESWIR